MITSDSKICSRCKEEKSLDLFSKGNGKFQKKNYCKNCDNKAAKENYLSKREDRIEQVLAWNSENPDKIAKYQQKWRESKKKV